MTLNRHLSLDHIKTFLEGSAACDFDAIGDRKARYDWIRSTLVQVRYRQLGKRDKGLVIRYLMTLGGYSRQQVTRLIRQWIETGYIVNRQRPTQGFQRTYTDADIRRLAALDDVHLTPSGGVIKKLCERAYRVFGDSDFERLATISISHIYNLRQSKPYRDKRRRFEKTRPKSSSIGERRKPQPAGKPGYLRVDTVHQGDQDGVKGVYHINLVDEVTQFTLCCCVEKISERFLVPAVEMALAHLPFKIRGFHTDNGSEYINRNVAELLEKLRIEFTKSRARQCNDNALAESKNASVIRKHFGHSHIPQHWASTINERLQLPLYRYVNFHRPCYFPVIEHDKNGKERKKYRYRNMMTPYEKLRSLANVEDDLKPGVSLASLDAFAQAMSDTQAAKHLQRAKQRLFQQMIADDRPRAS